MSLVGSTPGLLFRPPAKISLPDERELSSSGLREVEIKLLLFRFCICEPLYHRPGSSFRESLVPGKIDDIYLGCWCNHVMLLMRSDFGSAGVSQDQIEEDVFMS